MRIRSARNDDWKACLELDLSYETEIAWQMEETRNEKEWSARFSRVRLPRIQTISPVFSPEDRLLAWQRRDGFWVATERSKILGYLGLILEIEHRQARIADLVVGAEYRRQGIGERLLQHATTWCQRQNVEQLLIECQLKAQPAIGFVQKHGFAVCGFQDAYWPGQEVALFFRKRIR
ncbi:MAG: GNAT family N-acetyltransferase [Anaerolineae bacterium]|nr:GNAT family N-acetyltransferase [Anaerolineae bacterium]